jgi:hypothetical protein
VEGVLLSGEQIDADVGAGLPSPIGEEQAFLEEVSRVSGFAQEYAGEHLAELLVQQVGVTKNVTALG